MTKKFVSLVLSLALVIGLIPTMSISVFAAGGTTYTFDDFESYDVSVYSNAQSPLKVDDVSKWAVNASAKVEVYETTGIDGKVTKAMKYYNQAGNGQNITSNSYRVVAQRSAGHSFTNEELAGHVYVQETDIFLPANIELEDGTTDLKRPYKASIGYGAAIQGDNLYLAGNFNTGYEIKSNQWYNVKTAFDYTSYTGVNTPATYTVYVNDVPVFHKTVNSSTAGDYIRPSKSFGYLIIGASGRASTTKDASGEFNDIYFAIDNFHAYTDPDTVSVSSVLSDASNVSSKVSPVINFSEKLLNTDIHADGVISKDNIEFYKSADSSATVEINEPVVSDDDKSITIDPVDELVGGVEYTVIVKNLKDMYGRDIPSATFNFTVAEPSAITVSKPVFSRENLFAAGASQNITALENGYIKASSTVNNSANTDKEVLVLAMLKDGDDIKYFQFKNITVPANGSATFTGGFQVDNASTQKIETVVWDSIYNKTPLADKYEFSSSGFEKTVLEDILGE